MHGPVHILWQASVRATRPRKYLLGLRSERETGQTTGQTSWYPRADAYQCAWLRWESLPGVESVAGEMYAFVRGVLSPCDIITDTINAALTMTMAVVAVNGGLIPWHLGMATPIGRFQVVLGREAAVYLFGRTRQRDALLNYGESGNLIWL